MSEEWIRGCDPSDFADQEATRRIIADGTWISASEARDMVSQGWRDEGKPTDAICRRAKHGEIRAKALRWITIENGHRYERPDELIPSNFWADRDMKQDWSHGDFVSTIYPDDTKFEIEALGVNFDRTGIEAMVPSAMQVKASPVDLQPMVDEPQLGEPPAKAVGGGKLPSLPDAALQRWWNGLSGTERELPRGKLHKRCVAAHPNNSISRVRVREIAPTLRPGPRPIKPDSSA